MSGSPARGPLGGGGDFASYRIPKMAKNEKLKLNQSTVIAHEKEREGIDQGERQVQKDKSGKDSSGGLKVLIKGDKTLASPLDRERRKQMKIEKKGGKVEKGGADRTNAALAALSSAISGRNVRIGTVNLNLGSFGNREQRNDYFSRARRGSRGGRGGSRGGRGGSRGGQGDFRGGRGGSRGGRGDFRGGRGSRGAPKQ